MGEDSMKETHREVIRTEDGSLVLRITNEIPLTQEILDIDMENLKRNQESITHAIELTKQSLKEFKELSEQ